MAGSALVEVLVFNDVGVVVIQKMKWVATRRIVEIKTMVEIKNSCSQPRLDLAGSCAPVFESGDDTYMKRAAINCRCLGSSWKNHQFCEDRLGIEVGHVVSFWTGCVEF